MIRIIANPAAGRGRARRLLPAARAAFARLGRVEVRETREPGDEARLAREALNDGAETIVALGGDGTWSGVAAVMVAARTDCILAPLAGGTGNDLAKSLAIPASDFVAVAALVARGATRRIDVGYVDDRCFVNAAGFGFDAAVLEAAAGRVWPRGNALYLACAMEQLFSYGGITASIGGGPMRTHLLLVIANGARFGGSFHIAPEASVSDSMLDVVAILDATPVRRMLLLAAATRGAHIRLPEAFTFQERETLIRFTVPPVFEADGELHRAASPEVRVRCVPGALRVITSESFAGRERLRESAR
jgi:diacylglycerol kinase (ATP)